MREPVVWCEERFIQGSVMSPTLLKLIMEVMLREVKVGSYCGKDFTVTPKLIKINN